MTRSEMLEWGEYLSTTPEIQEYQMARLIAAVLQAAGAKSVNIMDYMLTKEQQSTTHTDIDDLTEDQINEIAGVA